MDFLKKSLLFIKRVIHFMKNQAMDIIYLGRPLGVTIKTKHVDKGAHDSGYSDYGVIKYIFKYFIIMPNDVLVDVGCAKGRVIGWWLKKGYYNKIIGIELDDDIAKETKMRFLKYKNVTIINGDIIDNIPENGSVFYLFNPFNREVMERFQQKLYATFHNRHNIAIIYCNCIFIDVFCQDGYWDIEYLEFPLGLTDLKTAIVRLKM
jgi:hypothetical protein